MPRSARLDAPGVLHHVIGRGIEKQKIFQDDRDRNDFLYRLANLAQTGSLDIYAWALLPNHFHMLCKTKKRPLASSMRKLLTGYAVRFNRRHGRHGHLFQNRYKSIVCQEDNYLRELVRYIHLNLLRANVVGGLDELNRSPWSGHSALLGNVKRGWQDTDYVLAYFGKGHRASRDYLNFVVEGISLGRRPELVGGGLIRSLGGWASVLALRHRGERQASDERVLGDADFVEAVWSEANELGKENLRLRGKKEELSSLAEKVCRAHRVSVEELRSGSRRHPIVEGRRDFCRVAIMRYGYSGAEVARFLGVTNSSVIRSVSSGEGVNES